MWHHSAPGVFDVGTTARQVDQPRQNVLDVEAHVRNRTALATVATMSDAAPPPEVEAVTEANQRFYDAHEERNLDAMREVWLHSERAVCIHPGWPILRTWPTVEESWRRILEGPGRNQFILTNVAIDVSGASAWVTLEENLVGPGGTQTVAATNVFVRTDAGWKLVAHHGSPIVTN